MAKEKHIGDYHIQWLNVWCSRSNVVTQKKFPKILIGSDAILVANSINDNISVIKDIISLVENIGVLVSIFMGIRIELCNRSTNRKQMYWQKMPINNLPCTHLVSLHCWFYKILYFFPKKKQQKTKNTHCSVCPRLSWFCRLSYFSFVCKLSLLNILSVTNVG